MEPFWLSAGNLIGFNRRAVTMTGEPHFVRDPSAVHAIAARPQHLWHYGVYRDLFDLASLYIEECDRRQAFLNGNKRTGFIAATAFIEGNDYIFLAPDRREQAIVLIEFANHRANRRDIADWLRDYSRPTTRRFKPGSYRQHGIYRFRLARSRKGKVLGFVF